MKVLLVTFLVAIVALLVIALPHHHPHHNGTSHHHPPVGQWNGTNAAGSAGRFNRTFPPSWFRPPRWGWRNNSRPFSFQPQEVQVQDQQFNSSTIRTRCMTKSRRGVKFI
uniref:Putative hhh secreted protein n=1 Tax=Psorophora albipes TaxID=869069 RepID=T1D5G6_9DIPT